MREREDRIAAPRGRPVPEGVSMREREDRIAMRSLPTPLAANGE
jgi:hypothetical protein